MTLLELTNSVIANTRRSDKVAYIHESLNLCLQELVQLEPFKTLRSETDLFLEATGSSVSLPSVTAQVVQVRLLPPPSDTTEGSDGTSDLKTPGYLVDIWSQKSVQEMFPDMQASGAGIPECCFVDNAQIKFVPPANQPYTVRVLMDGYAPDMIDDNDENPLPQCDNAMIAWSSSRVFKSLGLWEDAGGWDQEYGKAFRIAKGADTRLPGQRRQMKGAMSPLPRYFDPRVNYYTGGSGRGETNGK